MTKGVMGVAVLAVLSGSFEADAASFEEDFESFSVGETWAEGTTHGDWKANYTGYGKIGISYDGSKAVSMAPMASTSSSETHAVLVTSADTFGDFDATVRMKTVRRLRTPTPNAWEVAWFLWHFTDDTHFYYLVLKPNGWEIGKEDPAYAGAQRFLATGSSPTFRVGKWYTVEVKQSGATIEVTVDGVALASFTDTERPYLSGAFGFYSEDARVRFDDLSVE